MSRQIPATIKAAIDWMVLLDSGLAQPEQRQAFERWLAADADHRLAWQSLHRAVEPALQPLLQAEQSSPGSGRAAISALRSTGLSLERRKLLRGGTALALLAGLPGLFAVQQRMPLSGLLADLHSATAERKRLTLADGSLLVLNARSSVDVQFSAHRRLLRLREGELSLTVAADATRPFEVITGQGRITALESRFTVRQQARQTLVGVQQQRVQVHNLHGQEALVESGNSLRFDSEDLFPLGPGQARADAWLEGLVDVRNEPLGAVIDSLRPYRYGLLRISEAAARLRVFGVFPLDDTQRALETLAQTLPIEVRSYGPVTLVDLRQDHA